MWFFCLYIIVYYCLYIFIDNTHNSCHGKLYSFYSLGLPLRSSIVALNTINSLITLFPLRQTHISARIAYICIYIKTTRWHPPCTKPTSNAAAHAAPASRKKYRLVKLSLLAQSSLAYSRAACPRARRSFAVTLRGYISARAKAQRGFNKRRNSKPWLWLCYMLRAWRLKDTC